MKKLLAVILILSALLSVQVFAEDNIYNKICLVNPNLPAHEIEDATKVIDNAEQLEALIEYVKTYKISDKETNTVEFKVNLSSTSDFEENRHLFDALPDTKVSLSRVSPDVIATAKIKAESLTPDVLLSLAEIDCVEKITAFTKMIPQHFYPAIVMNFTDVPEDAWYRKHVEKAYFYGIMEGSYNDPPTIVFEPSATLTRAMLVTIIGRFNERINGTLPESTEFAFSDVKAGKWYSNYVAWAAEKGVVEGYPDGSFRPDAPVTREEAVTILGRYYHNTAPKDRTFNDELITYHPHNDTDKIADWAQNWVLDAMMIGAVDCELFRLDRENPEYYFEPKRSMTRAEAAKVAYVYLNELELSIERGYSLHNKSGYIPVTEEDLKLKEELKHLYQ